MTELEKHKKLNFLFYKIFRELYQGKTNPSSLGEVGKITDILVSSIFSKSNNENYDLNSNLKEEDLDLLENIEIDTIVRFPIISLFKYFFGCESND